MFKFPVADYSKIRDKSKADHGDNKTNSHV